MRLYHNYYENIYQYSSLTGGLTSLPTFMSMSTLGKKKQILIGHIPESS